MRQRIGSRYFVTERGQDPGKGFLTGTEAAGIAVGKTDRSDRSMIEGDALAPRALLGNKGCTGGNASKQIVEQHGIDRGSETRSEEHTSELQSLMRISYAVFCLKKKKTQN